MPDSQDERTTSRALLRLWRRYALSLSIVFGVIGVAGASQIWLYADYALLEREDDHISAQLSALADITQHAATAVMTTEAAERRRSERRLGLALDVLRASRRCPRADAMDPEMRALYLDGEPSLCARADRFIAAADRVARGPAAAQPAFTEMLAQKPHLRRGLEAVRSLVHGRRTANVRLQRDRLRLGLAAVAALLLSQAVFVFRPTWRGAAAAETRRDGALCAARETAADLRAALADLDASRREAVAAHREAERADRLKTEFLARTSHELRTPLNGVLGSAAMLDRSARPDQRRSLDAIRCAGSRLLAMIDDMIDLARLSSGDLTLEAAPFELDAMLAPIIADTRKAAAARGLRFDVDIDPDAPACYVGDRRRVERALRALLDNAVKFADRGGVALIVAPWGDAGLLFAVEDDGPGVPLAERERIFEHFSQVDGSETRPRGGMGQGLALARAVMRAVGGEIGVGAAARGGARFWLRVPLLRLGPAAGARDDAAIA